MSTGVCEKYTYQRNDFFKEGKEYTFLLQKSVFKSTVEEYRGYFYCTDQFGNSYKCTSVKVLKDV